MTLCRELCTNHFAIVRLDSAGESALESAWVAARRFFEMPWQQKLAAAGGHRQVPGIVGVYVYVRVRVRVRVRACVCVCVCVCVCACTESRSPAAACLAISHTSDLFKPAASSTASSSESSECLLSSPAACYRS
jgi:hypothetical protein